MCMKAQDSSPVIKKTWVLAQNNKVQKFQSSNTENANPIAKPNINI